MFKVNNTDTRTAPMTLFLTLNRQMPDGMLVFKISLNRSKLTAARQGGFIVLHLWEIVARKNLTIFEGCHFARFYILIWWSFPRIGTKNFNSDPCFFKLVKLGTISPAAHFLNCVHIGRSQTIAAIIRRLSSEKRFLKLREIF